VISGPTARCSATDVVKCYVNRRGKDFISFEEARELVRGMGLLGSEVREPSP
jgi:hypothetical protein